MYERAILLKMDVVHELSRVELVWSHLEIYES